MRTTLDIDDDVLIAVKELARAERLSGGKILSRLARQALALLKSFYLARPMVWWNSWPWWNLIPVTGNQHPPL